MGLWPGEYWTPQIETFRRGDEFVVRADLPGLKPEEVTVEATDDTLAIHGERRREHEEHGEGWYRSERSYGSFHRRIALPEGVAADDIQAQFKDGVLEVKMPAGHAPEQRDRGRRIEVKGR
jgi:HSP20 family protein